MIALGHSRKAIIWWDPVFLHGQPLHGASTNVLALAEICIDNGHLTSICFGCLQGNQPNTSPFFDPGTPKPEQLGCQTLCILLQVDFFMTFGSSKCSSNGTHLPDLLWALVDLATWKTRKGVLNGKSGKRHLRFGQVSTLLAT